MSNFNIPAGPWSFEAPRSVATPAGTFTLDYGTGRAGYMMLENAGDMNNITRAVAELPALLEALEALYARAAVGLDQSATHDGLRNCDALAKARAALHNVNRSN